MPSKTRRLRVLGVCRKSVVPRDKKRLESDPLAYSLEGQRDKITSGLAGDHEIVAWAEDEGVSGAVSPFDRPSLGPWFKRLDEWDALGIARFDRASRSVADFSRLCEWLNDHGKLLVCMDPPIDLGTIHGRAFANMLAVFAQYERELIGARVSDKWNEIRDAGRFGGGAVPFGRMPVSLGREGWALVPDPQYQPVVHEMVSRYVAGSSRQVIADWLNAREIPTSLDAQRKRTGREMKGTKWEKQTVALVLGNPGLGGFVASNGDLRRDGDGMLITVDSLIPKDLYERLQVALTERSFRRRNASRLRGVVFCFLCSEPMHALTDIQRGVEYRYYICRRSRDNQCGAGVAPADCLEELAAQKFLDTVGAEFIREPVYIAGTDASAELTAVQEAIGSLEEAFAAGNVYAGADGAQRFARMMSRLEERQGRLAAIETVPDRIDYRETKITFRQRWEELDGQGRRMLMADSGFRLYYARVGLSTEEVRKRAQAAGITRTAQQLRTAARHLREKMSRNPGSPRTAGWDAELAEIEGQRATLREIPRYTEYSLAPTGSRLRLRAGLASAGQVADQDGEEDWQAMLAPAQLGIARSLARLTLKPAR